MTEEKFILLAKAKYAEINSLKEKPTLLDYEAGFVEIWQQLGREVLQANLGEVGEDRRKKRSSDPPLEALK